MQVHKYSIKSCKKSQTPKPFRSIYWATLAKLKSADTVMPYVNMPCSCNPVLINKHSPALNSLKCELNMSKHKIQMFIQRATHRRLTLGDLRWAEQGSESSHPGCPHFTFSPDTSRERVFDLLSRGMTPSTPLQSVLSVLCVCVFVFIGRHDLETGMVPSW